MLIWLTLAILAIVVASLLAIALGTLLTYLWPAFPPRDEG